MVAAAPVAGGRMLTEAASIPVESTGAVMSASTFAFLAPASTDSASCCVATREQHIRWDLLSGVHGPPFFRIFTSTMSYSAIPIPNPANQQRTRFREGSGVVTVELLSIHDQLHRRGGCDSRFGCNDLEELSSELRPRRYTSSTVLLSGTETSITLSSSSTVGNTAWKVRSIANRG